MKVSSCNDSGRDGMMGHYLLPTGEKGSDGVTGSRGPRGDRGEKGNSAMDGDRGEKGILEHLGT